MAAEFPVDGNRVALGYERRNEPGRLDLANCRARALPGGCGPLAGGGHREESYAATCEPIMAFSVLTRR